MALVSALCESARSSRKVGSIRGRCQAVSTQRGSSRAGRPSRHSPCWSSPESKRPCEWRGRHRCFRSARGRETGGSVSVPGPARCSACVLRRLRRCHLRLRRTGASPRRSAQREDAVPYRIGDRGRVEPGDVRRPGHRARGGGRRGARDRAFPHGLRGLHRPQTAASTPPTGSSSGPRTNLYLLLPRSLSIGHLALPSPRAAKEIDGARRNTGVHNFRARSRRSRRPASPRIACRGPSVTRTPLLTADALAREPDRTGSARMAAPGPSQSAALFLATRPRQWVKNLLVFAAPTAAGTSPSPSPPPAVPWRSSRSSPPRPRPTSSTMSWTGSRTSSTPSRCTGRWRQDFFHPNSPLGGRGACSFGGDARRGRLRERPGRRHRRLPGDQRYLLPRP